jgi:hypothetical protein
VILAAAVALIAILAAAGQALAHTRVEAGTYSILLGWRNEPVIVGERNALILEITEGEAPVEGVERTLELTVFYGGESFIGQLAPTGEPGVYAAEIFPTVRGQYEVQLTGAIGDEPIDLIAEPEAVLPANVLQFPVAQADPGELSASVEQLEASLAQAQTTALAGLILGLAGLILGAAGLFLAVRVRTGAGGAAASPDTRSKK